MWYWNDAVCYLFSVMATINVIRKHILLLVSVTQPLFAGRNNFNSIVLFDIKV